MAQKGESSVLSQNFVANGETLYIRVDETKPVEALEKITSEVQNNFQTAKVELDRPASDDQNPRLLWAPTRQHGYDILILRILFLKCEYSS